MIWVGITGSMGSGKSTVSKIIQASGYPVISADHVAREVTIAGSDGLAEVVKTFGQQVLMSSGELDRQALSEIVFKNKAGLKKLEAILHPLIQTRVRDWKKDQEVTGQKMSFYDVPLLFENNLQDQFDYVICVISPEDQVISRVKQRDGIEADQIKARLANQLSPEEKKSQSDFVIENNSSLQDLDKKVQEILLQLKIK